MVVGKITKSFYLIFWSAATVLCFVAAVLVAPLPADPDGAIVTRAIEPKDPLHLAFLMAGLQDKLLSDPLGYYSQPFLYPDPNPMRGTETFLSEALLALPFRLALGERPALVYSLTRILSIALSALFTALLLRELGVRALPALAGGLLSVLVATNYIFIDRLQAVSFQWPALALYFTAAVFKRGLDFWRLTGFAASCFLLVHGSLYTVVLVLALAPFLLLALIPAVRVPGFGRKLGFLAAAGLIAVVLFVVTAWPWMVDRWDIGAFTTPDFLKIKRWDPAIFAGVSLQPPEASTSLMPIKLDTRFDGYYPGHAVVLTLLIVIFALIPVVVDFFRRRREIRASLDWRGIVYYVATVFAVCLGTGLALIGISWLVGFSPFQGAGPAVDAMLWLLLLSWALRLAFRPEPWRSVENGIAYLASACFYSALILFLLALGSPVRLYIRGPDLAHGIFAPYSQIFTPVLYLREIKRFLAPAGWFLVVGAVLALNHRFKDISRWVLVSASIFIVLLAVFDRAGADLVGAEINPLPDGYKLLESSTKSSGLLELPLQNTMSMEPIQRMGWQREHGRPILSGYTGYPPAWYPHAMYVFNGFPSAESLWLAKKWGIESVLISGCDEPIGNTSGLQDDLILRGKSGSLCLYDIESSAEPQNFDSRPGGLNWVVPAIRASRKRQARIGDGSTTLGSSIRIESAEGLEFRIPDGRSLVAVEIDYGYGLLTNIPSDIRLMGIAGDREFDLTRGGSGRFLRARAADLLMNRKPVRLIIVAQPNRITRFRLVANRPGRHVPELRVGIAEEKSK